jgi:hypothetical protein
MGITRRFVNMSGLATALIMLVLICVSSWNIVNFGGHRLRVFVENAVQRYDGVFPEITIENGIATVKGEQPLYVNTGDPNLVIVIDTSEGKEKEYVNYLGKAQDGAALTRNSVVVKNQGQTKEVPLKDMPNIVISSKSLEKLLKEYGPWAARVLTFAVFFYFLFAKPIQLLLMALFALFLAKILSVTLPYGKAVRIAALGMIPPVLLDLSYGILGQGFNAGFWAYFGMYMVALFILLFDLKQNPEQQPGPNIELPPVA